MRLARPTLDFAATASDPALSRAFWEGELGARFEREFALAGGGTQHRLALAGSSIKLNVGQPAPANAPLAGWRVLVVARAGLAAPRRLRDPDGNRVELVPPGHEGVTGLAMRMVVRSLAAHRRFFAGALGLAEVVPGRFACGESLLLVEEGADAPEDAGLAGLAGPGWRYPTIQVMRLAEAHDAALAGGARVGWEPALTPGHARYSMLRDPDGNWIELAQRADLAGTLD
ncbi:VOC family protein [Novosphingobium bradum]|uniref:VOC family protein n=1 Tax=Novosphingobium bradum TaxID=1737444 RepID=A0ABV7IM44_9SPHN